MDNLKTKIDKIIENYAHDYRDMAINEIQLQGILIALKNEFFSFIQSELMGCVGEESNLDTIFEKGRDNAIRQIIKNLKEKGLIIS